jgi:hypothetical protein
MIAITKAIQPARALYQPQLQARLAVHLKLDLMIWAAIRRYLRSHDGDTLYWMQHCQPLLNMLREHYRLTQLTSRPLPCYRQHVEKMVLRLPRQVPTTKRAMSFLALIEVWYWREYD